MKHMLTICIVAHIYPSVCGHTHSCLWTCPSPSMCVVTPLFCVWSRPSPPVGTHPSPPLYADIDIKLSWFDKLLCTVDQQPPNTYGSTINICTGLDLLTFLLTVLVGRTCNWASLMVICTYVLLMAFIHIFHPSLPLPLLSCPPLLSNPSPSSLLSSPFPFLPPPCSPTVYY